MNEINDMSEQDKRDYNEWLDDQEYHFLWQLDDYEKLLNKEKENNDRGD